MKAIRHIAPELRIFQGSDCLAALPAELDRVRSRRAVIFCGTTLGKVASPLAAVREAMGDRCAGVYAGVKPDSPVPAVEEAARELQRLGADAVVAVGGGSAIVTARAAAILLAEQRETKDLCTRQEGGKLTSPKLLAPKLPQFVIPTTPTTASVKAGSAVLDPVQGMRMPLFDPKTRAKAVFIHPGLVASTPRKLFVSAGLNTLALAVEGLLSRDGDPISDAMLIHAARIMSMQLVPASRGDDPDVRADLMMASLLCGHGTDYTGAGMAIPVGHAIGTQFDVDMGTADAIVMPHVLRFNADAAQAGLRKLADALGLQASGGKPLVDTVISALEHVYVELNVPRRLRDVAVPRDALPALARIAFGDWFIKNNPRPIRDASELLGVLEQAW